MFEAVDFWSFLHAASYCDADGFVFQKVYLRNTIEVFFSQKDTTATALQPAGLSSAFLTSSDCWLHF